MDILQVMTKSIRNDFQEKTYQQFKVGFPTRSHENWLYWTPEVSRRFLTPVVNKAYYRIIF